MVGYDCWIFSRYKLWFNVVCAFKNEQKLKSALHRKLFTANTMAMRCFFLPLLLSCTLIVPCSACANTEYSFDEENSEISSPINTNVEQNDDTFWNVKDCDISHINPDKKLVALTFDDGPSTKLERLLSVFASFNEANPNCIASATLFCNGRLLTNDNRPAVSIAYALGWELGNHSYSHTDFFTLSHKEIQNEIQKTDELLQKIDGKTKHIFRPPFGNLKTEQKSQIAVPIAYWTVDTLDWTEKSPEDICQKVLGNIYDGAIVLLHDGYEQTVQAVKLLLPALKENGYQTVTLSQMSKYNACPLKNGGAYIRIRKQKTF